jgi:uncharacterized membrane protein
MKYLYLGLAIAGFFLTYGLGAVFVVLHGWDISLFWDRSIGNTAAASAIADATLSVFLFWAFVYAEARRLKMRRWGLYILATFIFGLITPWGIFLYNRESYIKPQ